MGKAFGILQKRNVNPPLVGGSHDFSKSNMFDIFLILGTGPKFPRAVRGLEEYIKNSSTKLKCIVQTGDLRYKSDFFLSFNYIDRKLYERIIMESRLVITSDGAGNILTLIKYNKKFIVFPRRKDLGEIKINNLDLAESLKENNICPVVYDTNLLGENIEFLISDNNFIESKTQIEHSNVLENDILN